MGFLASSAGQYAHSFSRLIRLCDPEIKTVTRVLEYPLKTDGLPALGKQSPKVVVGVVGVGVLVVAVSIWHVTWPSSATEEHGCLDVQFARSLQ